MTTFTSITSSWCSTLNLQWLIKLLLIPMSIVSPTLLHQELRTIVIGWNRSSNLSEEWMQSRREDGVSVLGWKENPYSWEAHATYKKHATFRTAAPSPPLHLLAFKSISLSYKGKVVLNSADHTLNVSLVEGCLVSHRGRIGLFCRLIVWIPERMR